MQAVQELEALLQSSDVPCKHKDGFANSIEDWARKLLTAGFVSTSNLPDIWSVVVAMQRAYKLLLEKDVKQALANQKQKDLLTAWTQLALHSGSFVRFISHLPAQHHIVCAYSIDAPIRDKQAMQHAAQQLQKAQDCITDAFAPLVAPCTQHPTPPDQTEKYFTHVNTNPAVGNQNSLGSLQDQTNTGHDQLQYSSINPADSQIADGHVSADSPTTAQASVDCSLRANLPIPGRGYHSAQTESTLPTEFECPEQDANCSTVALVGKHEQIPSTGSSSGQEYQGQQSQRLEPGLQQSEPQQFSKADPENMPVAATNHVEQQERDVIGLFIETEEHALSRKLAANNRWSALPGRVSSDGSVLSEPNSATAGLIDSISAASAGYNAAAAFAAAGAKQLLGNGAAALTWENAHKTLGFAAQSMGAFVPVKWRLPKSPSYGSVNEKRNTEQETVENGLENKSLVEVSLTVAAPSGDCSVTGEVVHPVLVSIKVVDTKPSMTVCVSSLDNNELQVTAGSQSGRLSPYTPTTNTTSELSSRNQQLQTLSDTLQANLTGLGEPGVSNIPTDNPGLSAVPSPSAPGVGNEGGGWGSWVKRSTVTTASVTATTAASLLSNLPRWGLPKRSTASANPVSIATNDRPLNGSGSDTSIAAKSKHNGNSSQQDNANIVGSNSVQTPIGQITELSLTNASINHSPNMGLGRGAAHTDAIPENDQLSEEECDVLEDMREVLQGSAGLVYGHQHDPVPASGSAVTSSTSKPLLNTVKGCRPTSDAGMPSRVDSQSQTAVDSNSSKHASRSSQPGQTRPSAQQLSIMAVENQTGAEHSAGLIVPPPMSHSETLKMQLPLQQQLLQQSPSFSGQAASNHTSHVSFVDPMQQLQPANFISLAVVGHKDLRNAIGEQYTVYCVEVTDDMGRTWHVNRRFSEFVTLKKGFVTILNDASKGSATQKLTALQENTHTRYDWSHRPLVLPPIWDEVSQGRGVIGRARMTPEVIQLRETLLSKCMAHLLAANPPPMDPAAYQLLSSFLLYPQSLSRNARVASHTSQSSTNTSPASSPAGVTPSMSVHNQAARSIDQQPLSAQDLDVLGRTSPTLVSKAQQQPTTEVQPLLQPNLSPEGSSDASSNSAVPRGVQAVTESKPTDSGNGCNTQPNASHHHSNSSSVGRALSMTVRLMLDPQPDVSDHELFRLQGGLCAGCKVDLPLLQSNSPSTGRVGWLMSTSPLTSPRAGPRRCWMTGKLYCHQCHHGTTQFIPAHVLHDWDFTPRPVCSTAAEYLTAVRDQPLICVPALNPGLYARVPALAAAAAARKRLASHLARAESAGGSLASRANQIKASAGVRSYLLISDLTDWWALSDLLDISLGPLARMPSWLDRIGKQAAALATAATGGQVNA